jgi:hypothetical protein
MLTVDGGLRKPGRPSIRERPLAERTSRRLSDRGAGGPPEGTRQGRNAVGYKTEFPAVRGNGRPGPALCGA